MLTTHVPKMRIRPTAGVDWQSLARDPARQAKAILRVGFAAAPVVAGADKFVHLLTDWDKYLAPQVESVVGNRHQFMLIVGVIEIVAGIGVALWPRVFAYVIAAWLLGIILNLLMLGACYDIALRDLGLALGALALGRLSSVRATGP